MNKVKKYKGLIIILAVAFVICLVPGNEACAGNGSRMLGFSTRDSAMAVVHHHFAGGYVVFGQEPRRACVDRE